MPRRCARGLAFLRRTQASRRQLVRTLGNELCLRDLVGAVRAQRRRRRSRRRREVRRAVAWLLAAQNDDGGWGESGDSYGLDYRGHEPAPSTPSQTAWALLGLLTVGEERSLAVERGVDYLLRRQGADGFWREPQFTATGFPRVFYLRYHGYARFFPLWALARYRNLHPVERAPGPLRHVNTRAELARPVVAVTGLAVEARIAAGTGVRAIAGGGSARRLLAALERALARGRTRGHELRYRRRTRRRPRLRNVDHRRAIVTPSARWPCDAAWQRRLAARLPGARTADLAGVDAPVVEPADKRALQRATRRRGGRHRIAYRGGARRGARLAVRCVPGGRRQRRADAPARRPGGARTRWHDSPAARCWARSRARRAQLPVTAAHRDRCPHGAAGTLTRPSTPWPRPGLPGSRRASARRVVRIRTAPAAGLAAGSPAPWRPRCARRAS